MSVAGARAWGQEVKCEESERDGLIVRDNIKIRVSSGAVHLDIPIALVHRRLIGYP
jgi:hypothetical protein